jgi:hypothetical protein
MIKDFTKLLRKSDQTKFKDLLNSVDFTSALKIAQSHPKFSSMVNMENKENADPNIPQTPSAKIEKIKNCNLNSLEVALNKNKAQGGMGCTSADMSLNSFREYQLADGASNDKPKSPHLKNLSFLLDSILKFSNRRNEELDSKLLELKNYGLGSSNKLDIFEVCSMSQGQNLSNPSMPKMD